MSLSIIATCPTCLNKKNTEVGAKNDYLLMRCDDCQTIFAKVAFEIEKTADEVKQIYDGYYDSANFRLAPATGMSLLKTITSFENFRQTGKLLDIGFGEGGLLTVAEKNDWKCYGTELSPQALKYGDEKGWIVAKDVLSDERFEKNSFDIVTMIELIEHVPNPDDFLQTALSLLRPGGLLYLTTPNIKSINWRWLGIDWSVISPPEHIAIWSPAGMKKALGRNNFTAKEIRTDGFNSVEILARLRAKKGEKIAVDRNKAGFALNQAFTSSPWRYAIKLTVNRGLSIFRLGDGIKVWAFKQN
ncbi:MAG: class I SAM-dependent methyltransferase [Pyrinomonadaceae bacterium]